MTLPTVADVDLAAYDFLDLGAGIGGSMLRCEEWFGGRGLGIDIREHKVTEARKRGMEVVLGDIRQLPRKPVVRYVCLDNVLEHLRTIDDVFTTLEVATSLATDFVFIVHPSFEEEAYLRTLGLKQYWADWSGHPSHILLVDFADMFERLGISEIGLRFVDPIYDSSDSTIHPLDSPPDQHHYDESIHPPKSQVRFERPVHRELQIQAWLTPRTEDRGLWRPRPAAVLRNSGPRVGEADGTGNGRFSNRDKATRLRRRLGTAVRRRSKSR